MSEKLRELIQKAGLERIEDELVKLAKPSIRLKTRSVDENEISLGASKLGGSPDLPEGVSWATHQGRLLSFIAQINLIEAAPYDVENVLPHEGMLYFFYDAEKQPWGSYSADRGSWKAIYSKDIANLSRTSAPSELPADLQYPACAFELMYELTIPTGWQFALERVALDSDELQRYSSILKALTGRSPHHRLLGFPEIIQNEMEEECQLASHGFHTGSDYLPDDPRIPELQKSAVVDWALLLQVDGDSKANMMWDDMGTLYFWIERDRLKALDFENVWLILQCH